MSMVEIPVVIAFDVATFLDLSRARAATRRIFTMRYDTDPDVATPAQFCVDHPPHQKSVWLPDTTGVFWELFAHDTDKTIKARAAEAPETYAVTS